jgi:3',5'-cyclic-AMP phosphodiesterase
VLQGHLHVNELLRWKGTTFITGGAICGQWWRGPRLGTPEGFGVLTLHPDRVEWEYLTYGWDARRPAGQ